MAKKTKQNVGEWAVHSVNIQKGCENFCSYGYCQKQAKFHKKWCWPKSWEWDKPEIKWKEVFKRESYYEGVCMFATMHDMTMNNVYLYIIKTQQLLRHANDLLIVSKPRLEPLNIFLEFLLEEWGQIALDHIEFRFTIGCWVESDNIRQIWEPNASSLQERYDSVHLTRKMGFKTSISMEPLLTGNLIDLGESIGDFESLGCSEIWIGAMQYNKDAPFLDYQAIYNAFKGDSKVQWKSSFFKQAKRHHIDLGGKEA
jgi:hypothetical protein